MIGKMVYNAPETCVTHRCRISGVVRGDSLRTTPLTRNNLHMGIASITEGEDFMAAECSFDIVSEYDEQELVNAIDQARREVQTRFDLKDTKTEIAQTKDTIVINTESTLTLKGVRDILESKAVRRGLSLKIFKPGKEEDAASGRVRQVIELQQGIAQDLAKSITKTIRDKYPKVKPQIQGEAIRVSAKSRDELQAVIALLKEKDLPVPLQFINYRS
ncbi:protein of unknown function DUF520 [Ktedonobacter racemifer DSM 44963]|uniref:Nucleotide-binding protein Krac_12358 n=2 Tax=Ktedonobacter racemifer TaxID=363277 RepID=D6TGL3_KTERA|nr:protein of unknown function DUF520 [Ktedonobacter racemifer DSM 44963]